MSNNTKGRIYVPKAVSERLKRTLKTHAAQEFGGFTAIDAQGGWMSPNDELIEEPVTIIEVAGMDETKAASTARWLQEKSDETTVMWECVNQTHGFE